MEQFELFKSFFDKRIIKLRNQKLQPAFYSYSILHITKESDVAENQAIFENLQDSEVLIISHFKETDINNDDIYFVFSFKKTIILIKQTLNKIIHTLLSKTPKSTIFFSSNTKEFFNHSINIQNEQKEIDKILNEEIYNFLNDFYITNQFIQNQVTNVILKCIAGYLIKQGYSKLRSNNNENLFSSIEDDCSLKTFSEEDFIEIRILGIGSLFSARLNYYIEKEELVVTKVPRENDDEIPKLLDREIKCYSEIKSFFIPKFYGTVEGKNYPVIEFINGKTLLEIEELNLDYGDKITIIFQIITYIKYFHKHEFVYRDLKPNNIIIDDYKRAFIIDFDRMIKYTEIEKDNKFTLDFSSPYMAPEVYQGNIKYENDNYSLGKMIEYLNLGLKSIYSKCIDKIEKRPSILDLMFIFYYCYNSQINMKIIYIDEDLEYFNNIASNKGKYIARNINKAIHYYSLAADQNDPYAQYSLGVIYDTGKYITRDINKAIYYYSLAANQNDSDAQFNLGVIYSTGEYITQNIDKAIHYYSLAANQNDPDAQFNLGVIYSTGECMARDINKAIHYYSLAANQNHPKAQYELGVIYSEGKYITRDINKAIHYYSLAANQNHLKAQFNLGDIYSIAEYITRDINKAIHYYSLAANQNDPDAQYNLGVIYERGKYITSDINKAIYYYSLAANQNHPNAQYKLGYIYSTSEYITGNINKAIYYYSLAANHNHPYAQYNLGVIYSTGEYNTRDIDKAIHYYSLAANQNHPYAQYNLGVIYERGEYIARDINKAIHYFSLAANQNDPDAQFNLGVIYERGEYITRDINKAIHYYSLAVNQNHPKAQYNLGVIYERGEYVTRDINKAIHYYSLAASQNDPEAQFNLGCIYSTGEYITQDINKKIHYYSLAANQNHPIAQYNLGYIYIEGIILPKNINKAIYYFVLSSENRFLQAHFVVGFIYHEGKYVGKDMEKSIHYYKEGSTLDDQYCKNNLGIIFRYGYEDEIKKNLGLTEVYFEEAIRQKKDIISMYNLAHLYIYENIEDKIDKSIQLLFESYKKGFSPSLQLLCIALIIKHKYNFFLIKEELGKQTECCKQDKNIIIQMIQDIKQKSDDSLFDNIYNIYKDKVYLYNMKREPIELEYFNKPKEIDQNYQNYQNIKDITNEFYEGFGKDLY